MANILFLTQICPYPLNSGAKIRQHHMLRHHQVTLVSFIRPDDQPEPINLFRQCGLLVLPYRDASRSALVAHGCIFHRPLIVTREWALPEYVVKGETG